MHPTPATTLVETRAIRKGPLWEGRRSWDRLSWSRVNVLTLINTNRRKAMSHVVQVVICHLSFLTHDRITVKGKYIRKGVSRDRVQWTCAGCWPSGAQRPRLRHTWSMTIVFWGFYSLGLWKSFQRKQPTSWRLGGLKQLIHMQAPSQSSGAHGTESLTTKHLWPHKNLQLEEIQKATTR